MTKGYTQFDQVFQFATAFVVFGNITVSVKPLEG